MIEQSPIFVTGIDRSGSSLIARILEICGAQTGDVNGRYEHYGLKQLLSNYLDYLGIEENKQYPLPNATTIPIVPTWKKDVSVACLDIDKTKPWVLKSSRLAQLYPLWNVMYPGAKWIIVRRRSGDIISSCLQTAYMNSYATPKILKEIGCETERDGWLWWIHQQEKVFVQMIEQKLDCKIVWPERMRDGDYAQIVELLDWLNLKWTPEIVTQIGPLLK